MPRRGGSKLLLRQKPGKQTGWEPARTPRSIRPREAGTVAQGCTASKWGGGFHTSSHHVYSSIAPKFPVTDLVSWASLGLQGVQGRGQRVQRGRRAGASSPSLHFAVCPRDLALSATLPPAARPDPRAGTWGLAFTGPGASHSQWGPLKMNPRMCSVLPGRVRALGR